MDVSLESKSLPSVGYSRKSYLQVTYLRLARDKLVNLHGWRSLALPSVGLRKWCLRDLRHSRGLRNIFATPSYSHRAAELASILRFSASNVAHISGSFRRNSIVLCKKAVKFSQQKADFAALCKFLPSAWSDLLAMAVTSSFQIRIAHRLKQWIFDFLIFEMVYRISSIIWHIFLAYPKIFLRLGCCFRLFNASNIFFLLLKSLFQAC
ncbi:hypothetical protein AAG906_020471 [Vitis piasezkii]